MALRYAVPSPAYNRAYCEDDKGVSHNAPPNETSTARKSSFMKYVNGTSRVGRRNEYRRFAMPKTARGKQKRDGVRLLWCDCAGQVRTLAWISNCPD